MAGSEKYAGVQIARALAALAVAYYHSKTLLIGFPKDTAFPIPFLSTYGGFGVAFFFAISGFVVCLVTDRADFSKAGFFIKRAFRIYPLWIACSVFWWYFAKYNVTFANDAEYLIRSFLLLPTRDYPLIDVGWSLQHEVAFYLVAGLLVPFTGTLGLAAFLVLGWIANCYLDLPWWLQILTANYGYFLTGIVAWWAKDRLQWAGWLAPIALSCFIFWYSTEGGIPLPRHVAFPIAFFCALIGFINMRVTSWLGRLGVILGDASYSIYLLHPLVFTLFYQNLPTALPIWSEEIIRFAALGATCVLAILIFKFFETPINRMGHAIGEAASENARVVAIRS